MISRRKCFGVAAVGAPVAAAAAIGAAKAPDVRAAALYQEMLDAQMLASKPVMVAWPGTLTDPCHCHMISWSAQHQRLDWHPVTPFADWNART